MTAQTYTRIHLIRHKRPDGPFYKLKDGGGGGGVVTQQIQGGGGEGVVLQCMTQVWKRRHNPWIGFDRTDGRMRAMHAREEAAPLALHAVDGKPHTYTIRSERGWLGLGAGSRVFADRLSEASAMKVCFDMKRFEQTGRVVLKCEDNNRYISNRSASHGEMVAVYGGGGQSTENDIDYHMVRVPLPPALCGGGATLWDGGGGVVTQQIQRGGGDTNDWPGKIPAEHIAGAWRTRAGVCSGRHLSRSLV